MSGSVTLDCPCSCHTNPSPPSTEIDGSTFRYQAYVRSRSDAATLVSSLSRETNEWLLAIYVDRNLAVLSIDAIARGDVSGCEVPLWKLIHRGKSLDAAGFILVHNHPSGDPTPSSSDISATRKVAHVSRELDVPLLDHIIIGDTGFSSIGIW